MKEGWEIKTIGEVCEIVRPPYKILKKDYKEEGIYPIISQEEIFISGYADEESYLVKLDKPIVIFGDHSRVVKYIDFDFAVGADGVKVLYPKKNIESKYLYYIVLGANIESHGYARHYRYLKEKRFPLPPLPEQQRIVEVLDKEFERIDTIRRNAETSLQYAKDLMQAKLKEELQYKEGWERKKLGDLAIIKVGPFGSMIHKKDYISGGIPLVNPIHIKNGGISIDCNFSVSEDKKKELIGYVLQDGDVVFARRGEIGRCALVNKAEDGFLCGTGSLFARFKGHINKEYIMCLLKSEKVMDYLM